LPRPAAVGYAPGFAEVPPPMNVLFHLVLTLFLLVCLILVGLILIQKGRGGGLSSAFAGGGGGSAAFGAKTGDVLTVATTVVFAVFLLMGIALNLMAARIHRQEQQAPGGLATSAGPVPTDTGLSPASTALPDATATPATAPAADPTPPSATAPAATPATAPTP